MKFETYLTIIDSLYDSLDNMEITQDEVDSIIDEISHEVKVPAMTSLKPNVEYKSEVKSVRADSKYPSVEVCREYIYSLKGKRPTVCGVQFVQEKEGKFQYIIATRRL